MAEPMEDPMTGLEDQPIQPPQPSPDTAPSSRASTATLNGHSPSPPAQLPTQTDINPPYAPTGLPTLSLPDPSNITLPTLEPNPFSLFTNDAAPANNQSPFLAAAQRAFPQNNTRLSEAGRRASIRANLGRAFDFTAPPRRNRGIQRLYFADSPGPPPRPTNDSPTDPSDPPSLVPSNPPTTATDPPHATAIPSFTTDSEASEQRRQARRLERRELRRDDRQRQREIRRAARRQARQEDRQTARQLASDARQRERWQRRATAVHPNSPTRQTLIVRSRETIRDQRRAGRRTESPAAAAAADAGPPPAFDLRFFGGRPPNTEGERVARERARTDEAQAEAMAQEEIERLAAAGHPEAIASLRRRVLTTLGRPGSFETLFGVVPFAEALNADMGGGPEEIRDPAQQRAAELARLAARDARMVERARAMGIGPHFERVRRERREKVEMQKAEALREMEELLDRMAAKKGNQERERWAGRGGGALERLKTRLGESFRVLGGEVVLAHHAHVHGTDPTETLLKQTRRAARVNAYAANKAANAMSVPPITITPAEKKEVQDGARRVALATEEARMLSVIRSEGGVIGGGVTGVIRQEMRGLEMVFIPEATGVRVVPVGEQVADAPRVFMDAGGITGEIERRNLEIERMMARLESQREGVRRGVAELARLQEEEGMEGVDLERNRAIDEAVAGMERRGAELERRTAEVRMQGVEIQRRSAEADVRRVLERRREERERMGREQAAGQQAEVGGEIAGAAERMGGELRPTLFGPDAAERMGEELRPTLFGPDAEGARVEGRWRRLPVAGNVEVFEEVARVGGEDEVQRPRAAVGGRRMPQWRREHLLRFGGPITLDMFDEVPDAAADAGVGAVRGQLETAEARREREGRERARAEQGVVTAVVPVAEGAAVLGETAGIVEGGEVLTARETEMRAARESMRDSVREQIDSLVVPEDMGERYHEALEMVQMLFRGRLAD
ncbi:hypothetical protein VE02_03698 [Pseudogymnoascus sp. 03VT05]|nr:hypothetical protein VE02_03698 [Pseudogymnoascus sp. 03VT05]